jgi:diphthine synthase
MLYLIGLGLNEKGISLEGIEALKDCKKIYLESYTVDFPYHIKDLEKIIGKKVIILYREEVESSFLIKEAKKHDIALLIYGSPLFATTHESLIIDSEKHKIKIKVIYSASIFDAISETGLQPYKFGKITSIAKWENNFEPDSFLDVVEENISINAHSLILVDIGLNFINAINQLKGAINKKEMKNNFDKIIVCSNLGTSKSGIFYGSLDRLIEKNLKVSSPYCLIIPSKMHFIEKESVERFEV